MRRPGIALTSAIAWVGVVVGHVAAYLLTYPSQDIRHAHLEITGHQWMGLAAGSLLAVVPVILLASALGSVRSAASWSGPGFAARLLAVQIPVLAVIEVAERGWSVAGALLDPAVLVGLVLQPLLALLAAWIFDLLHRAVRAIVAGLQRPQRAASPGRLPSALEAPPTRSWLLSAKHRRAPPFVSYA